MEEIEQTVLNTYFKPPSLRVRCADDVYAIMEKTKYEFFHNYLNTVSTLIKFTKKVILITLVILHYCNKMKKNRMCTYFSIWVNSFERYCKHDNIIMLGKITASK